MKKNVSGIEKEICCGCHACFNICPKDAITMIKDSEGFLYPNVNSELCIDCGMCIKTCPGIKKPEVNQFEKVYACYAKNEEEHMTSTSGGFFAILAKKIIQENGFVCGAIFDDCLQVCHAVGNSIMDIEKMKKTKYVQSIIGDVFSQIKEKLMNHKIVLFSGTPCQVAGLKLFLGRDFDNLICVDLICHGVPSPEVFNKHLSEVGGENKVIKMSFRNKHYGDRVRTLDYDLDNGQRISKTYDKSLYIKGFIQNLYLRPSCFQCKYKGMRRCSDITIGDFIGIEEFHSGFSDFKGTSAVILHSKKGIQAFDKIKGSLKYIESNPYEVCLWNSCIERAVEYNHKRETFFKIWKSKTVEESVLDLQEIDLENKYKTADKKKIKLKKIILGDKKICGKKSYIDIFSLIKKDRGIHYLVKKLKKGE